MAFPAFLDTCTLFGQCLCDVLLSIAEQGAFTPYWSGRVLAAVERSVVERGHASPESMSRRTAAMRRAFPQAEVTGFEHLIDSMTNHPGDHHVLAACVRSPAQTLVTFNIKDFPAESLDPTRSTWCTPTTSCSTSSTCTPSVSPTRSGRCSNVTSCHHGTSPASPST